ncbi:hypothetical protein [Magpiepox virus 2]|nr:hypothetical protein [Magpiepox virus 2]
MFNCYIRWIITNDAYNTSVGLIYYRYRVLIKIE